MPPQNTHRPAFLHQASLRVIGEAGDPGISAAADQLAEGASVLFLVPAGPATEPDSAARGRRRRIVCEILSRSAGISADRLAVGADPVGRPEIRGLDGLSLPEVLSGISVSFSAREGLALVGLSPGRIGVDIETPIPASGIPWNLLRAEERARLVAMPEDERPHAFLELWTLKEAIAKALGKGFILPPEAIMMPVEGERSATLLLSGQKPVEFATELLALGKLGTACGGIAPGLTVAAVVLPGT